MAASYHDTKRECSICHNVHWLAFINPPVCSHCISAYLWQNNQNPVTEPDCSRCPMQGRCGNPFECLQTAPIGPRRCEGKICAGYKAERTVTIQAKYYRPVRAFLPRMGW
jgi:hypothetical protein